MSFPLLIQSLQSKAPTLMVLMHVEIDVPRISQSLPFLLFFSDLLQCTGKKKSTSFFKKWRFRYEPGLNNEQKGNETSKIK
jgi:hypothetical protein